MEDASRRISATPSGRIRWAAGSGGFRPRLISGKPSGLHPPPKCSASSTLRASSAAKMFRLLDAPGFIRRPCLSKTRFFLDSIFIRKPV